MSTRRASRYVFARRAKMPGAWHAWTREGHYLGVVVRMGAASWGFMNWPGEGIRPERWFTRESATAWAASQRPS